MEPSPDMVTHGLHSPAAVEGEQSASRSGVWSDERLTQPEQVMVLGTYRPAVTAVRALARRGRHVVVGREPNPRDAEGSAGVEASRHTARVWDHPSIDDADAFLDALAHELGRHDEPVHILPVGELAVIAVAGARARLPENCRVAAPLAETVAICIDKARCLDAAQAAGLPLLPHEVVRGHDELLAVAARLAPLVVKPLAPQSRLLGRKALLCHSKEEVVRQVPTWPAGHDRLLVQRLAQGSRHNLYFAARDGEFLDCVEVLTIRTDRRDGTGVGVEGRTRPVSRGLRAQLERLAAHLRYTGVGFGQFLVEPGADDGAFLELNPRLAGTHAVVDRAGLDLANLAVDLAAGLPVGPCGAGAPRHGLTYAWTFGDIRALGYAIKHEGIAPREALAWAGRIAWVALRADVHLTWCWRDPLPTLAIWWSRLAVPAWRHLVARRHPGDRASV
jgi:hypothetical protein